MGFFKSSFFKSSDDNENVKDEEINEKSKDSSQQAVDLEKQQLATEYGPQDEPRGQVETTPSTERIAPSVLQIPSPTHIRSVSCELQYLLNPTNTLLSRQSLAPDDPFTDDAGASQPATPTRKSSLSGGFGSLWYHFHA